MSRMLLILDQYKRNGNDFIKRNSLINFTYELINVFG